MLFISSKNVFQSIVGSKETTYGQQRLLAHTCSQCTVLVLVVMFVLVLHTPQHKGQNADPPIPGCGSPAFRRLVLGAP